MTASMRAYIAEQPAALGRQMTEGAVPADLPAGPWRKLWFVGSGTSLYAAMVAANLSEGLLGVDAEAISSQEFRLEVADAQLGPGTLAVAISQGGATVALTEAVARARRLGAATVGVTADPMSPLAQTAQYVVNSRTGPEDVPPKTKGFTTTAAAACRLGLAIARMAGVDAAECDRLASALEALPERTAAALAASENAAPALAARLQGAAGYFVAGTRTLVPAAYEGALKILETAKLLAEGRELEEILHGYFNAVGPETGVILLAGPGAPPEQVAAFCRGAAIVGAPLVTIALPNAPLPEADLLLPDPGHPGLAPLLGILPLQVLALHLALARGKDPNRTRYPELYAVFRTKAIHRPAQEPTTRR
jgi:glucosamine--fructose-6-phosphate aminotransferase (isomerizing)